MTGVADTARFVDRADCHAGPRPHAL